MLASGFKCKVKAGSNALAVFVRGEHGGFGRWLSCHSRHCSFKTLLIRSFEYLLRFNVRFLNALPPENWIVLS